MTRPLKIAISGVKGTGRTAIIEALSERFKNRSLIVPEFTLPTEEPPVKGRKKKTAQAPLSSAQFMDFIRYPGRELAQMQRPTGLVICERGIVDSFMCMARDGVALNDAELTYAENLLTSHAKTYDMVAYLPTEIPLKRRHILELPFRKWKETAERNQMDDIIRSAWKKSGVDVFEVTGPVEKRVETIANALNLKYDFA